MLSSRHPAVRAVRAASASAASTPSGGGAGTSLPLSPSSANGTILIYLSLFLLLLVFFIVLNAHSSPRDYRVRAVLGSVERTFAAQPADANQTELTPGRGSVAAIALAGLKRLGDLFETDLGIAKVDHVVGGRLMVVSMPTAELFEGESAFVRPERLGLLDRIAREIGNHDGVRFDMDFLIAVGEEPAGAGSGGYPVARGAAMARALIVDRAPADALSVGIEPGQGGTARFLFSVRLPGEPRGGVAGGLRATP